MSYLEPHKLLFRLAPETSFNACNKSKHTPKQRLIFECAEIISSGAWRMSFLRASQDVRRVEIATPKRRQ